MKIFGYEISREAKSTGLSIETVIRRLEAAQEAMHGVAVTPENCMQSPTVCAIVTAISRRIATLPVRVMRKATSNGRDRKEPLPNHPVTRLLQRPNEWQDSMAFWLDASSYLVRYGNFYAFKSRGQTGPIRQLIPFSPDSVEVRQGENWAVSYRQGGSQDYTPDQIWHARGAARDGLTGDSTVKDVRAAIALEIMAERMGASVFSNSAMPSLVFQFAAGSQGFKTEEERAAFVENFQTVYAKGGRFKAMLLPKGIELGQAAPVDNEKAQFLATRQYQRSVIAGAFGVPPHMVGDLSRGTFNNVEQQSLDFVLNVVLPYIRIFEASMERALLTDEDRSGGVIIRFNLEAALRGDFKSRQEGLKIQREMGVICPNEWREIENQNPISEEDGGEAYWVKGPSGQGAENPDAATEQPAEPPSAGDDEADRGNDDGNA